MTTPSPEPFDGVLLLSFGGPEQPDDVIPFLQNVTRGRGIPVERLQAVAEHYHHFGGRSPINDQNRALLAALRAELAGRGLADLPLYWGNRNWDPYLADALAEAVADGARRLAVIVTSAYPSYSGCRQYREDLADALAGPALAGTELALDKIRHYFNHPGFVAPVADGVVAALRGLPAPVRDGARVVFVTHAVPTAMEAASGPAGGAYTATHRDVARAVVEEVGRHVPVRGWDLVFCSRSGPPSQPWSEPDVNDHLRALHAQGVPGVVVVPVGFVSDHMEVVYDLDVEAAERAARLGLDLRRARTVGADPAFVAMVRELAEEQVDPDKPRRSLGPDGPGHAVCPAGCCLPTGQPELPAVSGAPGSTQG